MPICCVTMIANSCLITWFCRPSKLWPSYVAPRLASSYEQWTAGLRTHQNLGNCFLSL